jgi:hypothetical protein
MVSALHTKPESDSLRLRLWCDHLTNSLEHLVKRKSNGLIEVAQRLLLGHRHQVVGDSRQPQCSGIDEAKLVFLQLGETSALPIPQRFGKEKDRGERRSQIVSHLSHESERFRFSQRGLRVVWAPNGGFLSEEINRVQQRENAILVDEKVLTSPLLEETSPNCRKQAYVCMVQRLSSSTTLTQDAAIVDPVQK